MERRGVRPPGPKEEPAGAREDKSEFEPKTYSSLDQIKFGVKLALIVGAVVLVLWLLDKGV
jgi:hypothetical protein